MSDFPLVVTSISHIRVFVYKNEKLTKVENKKRSMSRKQLLSISFIIKPTQQTKNTTHVKNSLSIFVVGKLFRIFAKEGTYVTFANFSHFLQTLHRHLPDVFYFIIVFLAQITTLVFITQGVVPYFPSIYFILFYCGDRYLLSARKIKIFKKCQQMTPQKGRRHLLTNRGRSSQKGQQMSSPLCGVIY